MNIELLTIFKIFGWIFTITPLAAFLLFSIIMVREIAKNDDESLKGILNMGFVVFFIGAILLAVGYFGVYISGTSSNI